MSYWNDPRENVVRPESGVTLENDNRVEPMWQWNAAVLDLCGMPVSEYMKPSTVISLDGGLSPYSGDTSGSTDIYLVEYYNGSEVYYTENVPAGSYSTPPAEDPTREGMRFTGWRPDPNETVIDEYTLFIAQYTLDTDNILYYGALLNGAFVEGCESGLSTCSVSDAFNGEEITVRLAADEFLKEQDEEWYEEHYEEYIASHPYPTCVFVPRVLVESGFSITLREVMGSLCPLETDGRSINIDGAPYIEYTYSTPNLHASTVDQAWGYELQMITGPNTTQAK